MRHLLLTSLAVLAVPALSASCSSSDDVPARPAPSSSASNSPPPPPAPPVMCLPGTTSTATTQRVVVGADIGPVSPMAFGANVNTWFDHASGLWDPASHQPAAAPAAKTKQARVGMLRFPGGTAANLLHWKRLVGPRDKRSCNIDGNADSGVGRFEKDYGPAAFGIALDAIGVEGQVMVPFAVVSPEEAADLVEYLLAPAGTNPGGGKAWAEVRVADGHPSPIRATHFELGNEHDRTPERYWMTADETDRVNQYIDGAEMDVTDQPLARGCDFSASTTATSSDGSAGQIFVMRWGLIKKGTKPVVKVGGAVWTAVDDLSAAAADAQVYELDRADGTITFGDGTHGAIPPSGAAVTISYRFRHEGFIAIYEAMKAVATEIGASIDVCSTWAPVDPRGTAIGDLGKPSFAQAMKARKSNAYDCVVTHPYTNFSRDFDARWQTARDAHEQTMLGDAHARAMTKALVDDITTNGPSGRYVAISEFGALFFGSDPIATESRKNVPGGIWMMSHVLYMASQIMHQRRLGLGWVEGNTLISPGDGLRGVLGGPDTDFLFTGEAILRQALGPALEDGSTWLSAEIVNPELVGVGEKYPSLVAGASRAKSGAAHVVLVNRSVDATKATIDPGPLGHAAAISVTTVKGATFSSYQGAGGDNAIAATPTTFTAAGHSFEIELPAASVTILAWDPCTKP